MPLISLLVVLVIVGVLLHFFGASLDPTIRNLILAVIVIGVLLSLLGYFTNFNDWGYHSHGGSITVR